MAVMDIGIMRVRVSQFIVLMHMGMWFARRVGRLVLMPVVLVVAVQMLVRHRLMPVPMSVAFGEVEPHANNHQASGDPEKQRWLLV
jgi:hypothetical protein